MSGHRSADSSVYLVNYFRAATRIGTLRSCDNTLKVKSARFASRSFFARPARARVPALWPFLVVEHLAQFARELFRLTRISAHFGARESAVVAREDCRPLIEQLGSSQ